MPAGKSIGLLDYRSHDFEKAPIVKLDGDWLFFWNEFVPPSDVFARANGRMLPTPSAWHNLANANGDTLPAEGYGTYAVTVLLGDRHPANLSIKFKRVKMSYRLYVNGELFVSNGAPGTSAEDTVHFYRPYIADIDVPSGTTRLELVLHVANYKYPRGGIDESIYFGESTQIHNMRVIGVFEASFVAGGMLLMALYHFGLWMFRRSEKSTLVFGLFCMAMAIRMLTEGEKVLLYIIPSTSIDAMLGLTLGSLFFGIPVLHLVIYYLFPQEFSKKLYWLSVGASSFFCSVVLLSPLMIFASAIPYFEVYALFMLAHSFVVVAHAVKRKRQGALLFLLGFAAIMAAGVNDILFERGIINSTYLLHYGAVLFIFMQSFVLSTKFAMAFNQVEILKDSLELQVSERTDELQRLSNRMTLVLEDERKYIAQEVHDNFNSALAAIGMHSRKLEKMLARSPEAATVAAKITEIINHAYSAARDLVRRLRPEIIDTLGLKGALEQLVRGYNAPGSCSYSCNVTNDLGNVDENKAMAIYRITQEAITNTVKYAEARQVSVVLTKDAQGIVLKIKDDGAGFELGRVDGIGLISMRERATSLGGQFILETEPGKGVAITVTMP